MIPDKQSLSCVRARQVEGANQESLAREQRTKVLLKWYMTYFKCTIAKPSYKFTSFYSDYQISEKHKETITPPFVLWCVSARIMAIYLSVSLFTNINEEITDYMYQIHQTTRKGLSTYPSSVLLLQIKVSHVSWIEEELKRKCPCFAFSCATTTVNPQQLWRWTAQ